MEKQTKRTVIFETSDPNYRVVCKFGYDPIVDLNWWGCIQKKVSYKKYIFFGETKYRWSSIHKCWWCRSMGTMDQLKNAALDLYDEHIEAPKRMLNKAINLQ